MSMKSGDLKFPIFYSFRRCPYAMRARLSLLVSKQQVEIREVILKEKPVEFLKTSPSATVPCLLTNDKVIDESLDIMIWALNRNDPENWLKMPKLGYDLIMQNDGSFKMALDRTKYHSRFPNEDPKINRKLASDFIFELEDMIEGSFLFGDQPKMADMAILPFVRQFAFIDKIWFDQQPWTKVSRWLNEFLESQIFTNIQDKYNKWKSNSNAVLFPPIIY